VPRALRTERLRPWRAADGEAFAALNADPRVRALPGPRSREESDALADRIESLPRAM
jgi:hypothetical protein